MRVAMGLAIDEPAEGRTARVLEFYEAMSQFRYVPSTPTMFHAGTAHPQLSSCYLTTINDDLGLDDTTTAYDPDNRGGACPGGVFTITTTFTNTSADRFVDVFFEVITLTNGNTVLGATGGDPEGGVGAVMAVDLGPDDVLDPGESFTHVFEICLAVHAPFDFFVDVHGTALP